MSTYSNLPIPARLLAANTAITNALADPDIRAALAPYTYDETKLNEGKALYDEVEALHDAVLDSRGGQVGATADAHDQWAEARGLLRDKIARARIALRGDRGAERTLKLHQSRARRQADWIVQARQFYRGALGSPGILEKLAGIGLTEAALQEGLEAVNAFEQALQQRTGEVGAAQHATHARNESLATLDQWMRDFRDIARLALRDAPQQIEKLGFLERGS